MSQKFNKRSMARTIIEETKREGQRCTTQRNKKKREKSSPTCGRKVFYA
jgi:hypothetical protein